MCLQETDVRSAVPFTQFTSGQNRHQLSASVARCLWSMFCLVLGSELSSVSVLQLRVISEFEIS